MEIWGGISNGTECPALLLLFLRTYRKEVGLESIHTCKHSYMFRLYICSHHQAEYSTLNKKSIKIPYNCIYFIVFYDKSCV